jgi:ATP-dependent DNA ligase
MTWPNLDLPIVPPYPPMEAKLQDELPSGAGWQYEPKWDGFRCLVFKDSDEIVLQSKAGQPLGRYFPELVAAARALPVPRAVLDGEIVIPEDGGLSFEALLQRIHPAESRIRRLAAETPARLLLFDLLVDADGRARTGEPLEARRAALETLELGPAFSLSPTSRDAADAAAWLSGRAGTDGVVAKRLGVPYRSGERTGMVKVKREETIDCVVGGFRRGQDGVHPASLLLGLHDAHGLLQYVGHTTLGRRERAAFGELLAPLTAPQGLGGRIAGYGFTGDAPGGPSRWARGRSTEWVAVRPVVVVEVGYRHASGGRMRHGARLVRLRPDKSPHQCTMDQLRRGRAGAEAEGEAHPEG